MSTLHRSGVVNRRLLLPMSQWSNMEVRMSTVAAAKARREIRQNTKIQIPKKKKRDALTVLKALSSTVGTDFQGSNFISCITPDMPHIGIPRQSNYLASVERAGKSAARSFLVSYPDLFKHSLVDDPPVPDIKDYWPEGELFTINSATEEALLERIELRRVEAAYDMYEKLKQKGVKVSQGTMEKLLELLSYYGDTDERPTTAFERYSAYMNNPVEERFAISKAARVFREMQEKSPAAYNSILRGYLDRRRKTMHNNFANILENAEKRKIEYERSTYHSMLKNAAVLSKIKEMEPTQIIEKLLRQFHTQQHIPTLDTFNAALEGLNGTIGLRSKTLPVKTHAYTMAILSEMKKLNIEPTLFTWLLVGANYTSRTIEPDFILKSANRILPEEKCRSLMHAIMNEIEGKQYEFTDFREHYFLFFMMMNCSRVSDSVLARKIERFHSNGRNQHFMTFNQFTRKVFFRTFLNVVFKEEGVDAFMELYRKKKVQAHFTNMSFKDLEKLIVDPTVFEMEDKMEEFCELVEGGDDSVKLHFAEEFAKKEWSPKAQLKMTRCLNAFLMRIYTEEQQDMIVREEEGQMRRSRKKEMLTNVLLGQIMRVNLSADLFENAWKIFKLISPRRGSLPSGSHLELLVEKCIEKKEIDKAIEVLETIALENMNCLPSCRMKVLSADGISEDDILRVKSL